MLNGLDLFSGIGGITLALDGIARPVAYCENDRYATAVLLSQMRAGRLPIAPIWDDISTLQGQFLPQDIDIIYGGFPCQDISVAGTGEGLGGERSGLFFELLRLASEIRPRFIFLENVPAIVVRGLDRVLLELTSIGYDCRWTILSAGEMGAVHIRERWYLLANSDSVGLREKRGAKVGRDNPQRSRPLVIDSESQTRRIAIPSERRLKPRVGRTGDGIPNRVDRHRALGNAVHIEATREAFMRLAGLK